MFEFHPATPAAGLHAPINAKPCVTDSEVRTLHSAFESLPAHAISIKNKHLLVIYAIPTRGFTAAISVFIGTPPAKPLDCKIRPNSFGALSRDQRADPTGGEPRPSRAFLCFVPGDII